MAAIVDGCIITAALLAFTAVFAFTVGRIPVDHSVGAQINLQTAGIGAAVTLAVLTLLYQLLFFTFSEATPGMRYARIGLCTFSDDNPTRAAMRRRIFATAWLRARSASASCGRGWTMTVLAGTTASPGCISAATRPSFPRRVRRGVSCARR